MFVRFRQQKASRGSDYSVKIDIVQSYRQDNGNPTHKTIVYIGSYKVRNWKYKEREYCERERLWKKAEEVFKKLSSSAPPQITAGEEAKLRRELEARIPKPPPIPKPRVRGAALSWCNQMVWQKEPSWMNAYKWKP